MHAGARTGSIAYSARTVGVGAGLRVTSAPQRSPHTFRSLGSGRAHVTAPQRRRRS